FWRQHRRRPSRLLAPAVQPPAYNPAMIVDSAVYVDGRRSENGPHESLKETREACRREGGFAWIGLRDPGREEFEAVAGEFGMHELAMKEALKAHQRPRVEHYGQTLLVVLVAARYAGPSEAVEFGEIHAFVGPDFIVTVRHGEVSELGEVREKLEGEPEILRRGPIAVLHAIMERVVDDYAPVVDGLGNEIDEVEGEVFGGNPGVSRRIYELSRKVIRFHQAAKPLAGALERLTGDGVPGIDPEARRYLRAVEDRVLRVTEQIEGFRELLSNILDVNLTMVSVRQNDQVQKISAWAAILIVPTIITGIYGMNFEFMPELFWFFGYPFTLLLMVVVSVVVYVGFRRSGWL
ncbi:MAG: magnesium/cobalt transporter CorA, partial [Rubrobacter sp.]